jgi:hypothetical protein
MKTIETKSLLTKFFYKNEHLYFQILVQSESNTDVYGEYDDYSDYKTSFDTLQRNLTSGCGLKLVSDNYMKAENRFAKVA